MFVFRSFSFDVFRIAYGGTWLPTKNIASDQLYEEFIYTSSLKNKNEKIK